jgi:ubiquinone/menaquinone biosynthesis C-methylase UbiE
MIMSANCTQPPNPRLQRTPLRAPLSREPLGPTRGITVVDYDNVAPDYDRRYRLHDYPGIRAIILEAVSGVGMHARALEVGCGTGKWLAELEAVGCTVAGIDPSEEMLRRACVRVRGDIRRGSAEVLPWEDSFFDVVFCINSLHHFSELEVSLREINRVIRPGGTIVSVGLDPHAGAGRWYVYQFFPATLALDLARFPSVSRRVESFQAAGFADVSVRIAERLRFSMSLEEALRDGVLEKSFTSQLTALSSDAHLAGLRKIRRAAEEDTAFRLEVDLLLYGTQARKPV